LEISERRQAEAASRISEEKYRTILETIEDGYYEVDLKGSLIFFNDALARLHECPRDELVGINNRQYTDPENAKSFIKPLIMSISAEHLPGPLIMRSLPRTERRSVLKALYH
jgi:PAS domain-containing protein